MLNHKFDRYHWLFLLLALIAVTLLTIEDYNLLGFDKSEQELIQFGRDLELQRIYDTPQKLRDAIKTGEYDYDNLSKEMKYLIEP